MNKNSSRLHLYIDSVDSQDWAAYLPTGLFYGVTTNPKLLAAEGIEFEVKTLGHLARKAFDMGAEEIHLQVWGTAFEEMLAVGLELGEISERVRVKVPVTPEGLRCTSQLIKNGIGVTLTALHAAEQALLAAALSADYAAPYLGRMNDGGLNGMEEIVRMQRILDHQCSSTRLLVASIRHIIDLVTLSENGLSTFTLLPSLIDELIQNDLTHLAAASFQDAVERSSPG